MLHHDSTFVTVESHPLVMTAILFAARRESLLLIKILSRLGDQLLSSPSHGKSRFST